MNFIKEIWAHRYTYAQRFALIATPLNIFNTWTMYKMMDGKSLNTFLMVLLLITFGAGVILTIGAYCLGGFGTALKYALYIAKWGWRIVPFPFDLLTLIIAFIYSLIVLLILPIIPIRKACKENLNVNA